MREIKFRAWNNKLKRFSEDGTVCLNRCGHIFVLHNIEYTSIEQDTYTLLQYTGLHDSKGVEVYEGDILCFPERSKIEHDQSKPNHPRWYGVVTYQTDESQSSGCGFVAGGLIYKWSACEVIGNIYSNPELLGEE